MKKYLMLLIIPFLLTGCASVTYDLEIEKDLRVVESVNMSATEGYFDNFYMNLPVTIVEEAYNNSLLTNSLKQNNYELELRKNNYPFPSVFARKRYNSLEEYVTNTIYKGQSFDDIFVETKDNIVTIKTKDFIPYRLDDSDGDVDSRFPISNLSVSIKVPFVVKENNADEVNKKTNTYTWKIDEETKTKEIKIAFDKSKIYVYNLSWYISLMVIIIITFGLIIYIIIKVIKNKKNNSLK